MLSGTEGAIRNSFALFLLDKLSVNHLVVSLPDNHRQVYMPTKKKTLWKTNDFDHTKIALMKK